MQQRKLMTLCLIMSVLSSNISRADCEDVINAADKAIESQKQVINLKTQEIAVQDRIIKAQDTKIVELEKKNNIFSSPITYVVIGILAGIYIKGRI